MRCRLSIAPVRRWRSAADRRRRHRLAAGLLGFALALHLGCSAPPAPPPPNDVPSADAGSDKTAQVREEVLVDGSASSDPDGDPLTYSWSTGDDNPASLIIPEDRPSFSFIPTVAGDYWLILIVSDGELSSRPDSVRISVTVDANHPPIADAGPDLIFAADAIIPLSGINSSDPDGDPLTYLWQALQPPGPVEIADSTAVSTTVSATVSGDYRFLLTVSDGSLSSTDEVLLSISASANLPPVADAGPDQQVAIGTQVVLDGSASADPEEEPITFHWSVGRTPGDLAILSDSTLAQPTFTPTEAGEYVFGLIVSDGVKSSLQDVVSILVIEELFNQQEGMIEVPSGAFTMGSAEGANDERPVHRLEMSTFWIDQLEVTVADYQACVDAGFCTPAGQSAGCNAGRSDRPDHPINCVTWNQASDYCLWAEKRLPSEAEWEKAARGLDGRRFPWGDQFPSPDRLNYGDQIGTTTPVGTYPAGVSFYGLHNMGGNVHEWTADYYAADYYASSPAQDPLGPETGTLKVVRGASWKVGIPLEALTATVRQAFLPTTSDNTLGFRCARTGPPGE